MLVDAQNSGTAHYGLVTSFKQKTAKINNATVATG